MNLSLMRTIILAAALTAALTGISCEAKKTKQIVFLYDQSKSKVDGCDCLANVLERSMKDNSGSGAKITFFKLGEPSTGFEPKVVAVYDLPKNRRVTEGKAEAVEKQKQIMSDFRIKCRKISRSEDTPLAQAVFRIVTFLQQNGCDEDLGCQAIVQTDLQESVDNESLQKANEKMSPNDTAFNNAGISVIFHGVAEVEAKASKQTKETSKIIAATKSREELKNVWIRKFADPNLVKFYDFCSAESYSEVKSNE